MTISSAFLAFCAILVLAIFVEACWKRSLLAFWVGVFFAAAVWFIGPYGEEPHRVVGVLGVLLLGALTFWWNRSARVRAGACVFATMLTSGLIFLTSERANHLYFEQFVSKIFSFAITSLFAAVCLLYVLPRLDQKRQAPAALLLSCLSTAGMVTAAFSWWMTAVIMNSYSKNSVVQTRAELVSEYERTKNSLDENGVFLVGSISGGPSKSEDSFVAYYSLEDEMSYFPLAFKVVLADGYEIEVTGISRVGQTFNWEAGGPRSKMRCLRSGDPVVVWGNPSKSISMNEGKESYGIGAARLVASGSLEDFQQDFLLPGRDTAKLFGWLGFGCLIASFFVVIPGIAAFIILRKHGREELE